ncbi:MAG: FAD/NAD(P)-binding protein [Caldiserica bacterium]|nr:FAD/NAD(P)-binding protein [Caldisericota bacterium]MDH7561790.1 FAD/NAD(P)-binding protein [Caldisericota bacterium]
MRFESDDRSLKTLWFSFLKEKDREAFSFKPGQFIELSLPGKGESPFGIASSPNEELIKITVNKTGTVTRAIHQLDTGDLVGIRGPFGNSYPFEDLFGSDLFIISGGFAFTTLASLTKYLLEGFRDRFGKVDLVYGARTPGMLLYKDLLHEWRNNPGINLFLTVDREFPGWTGLVGFVPDIVSRVEVDPSKVNCFICGPPIMIRLTIPKLLEKGISKEKIFTSLERRMKCGIGKCGRCNIGPKFVCKDGPIFRVSELEGLPPEY